MKKTTWLLGVIFIMFAGLVSGASTLNAPLTATAISGDTVWNVTSTIEQIVNCTVTLSSTLTGQTFTINLTNVSMDAGNLKTLNYSLDLDHYIDASDYSASGVCSNASGDTDTLTGVNAMILDSSSPTCSQTTLTDYSTHDISNGSYTIGVTGGNATSLIGAFDGNSYTFTETSTNSDAFTYDIGGIPTTSYGTVIFTASDGLDSTACTTVLGTAFTGKKGTSNVVIPIDNVTDKKSTKPLLIIFGFLFVAVLLATFSGKKSGKKRR